jgi:hypothetical protein
MSMNGTSIVEQCEDVLHDLGVILATVDTLTDAGVELYEIVDGCVNDVISFQERHQLEADLEEGE